MEKKLLAERGFDPRTSGLWAQHASTAPLCCRWYIVVNFIFLFYTMTQVVTQAFLTKSSVRSSFDIDHFASALDASLPENKLYFPPGPYTSTT